MCKPLIAQDGYDSGLILYCKEHNTREPVMEGHGQEYVIDILTHLDMLIAHRVKYETPFFEQVRQVESIVEDANKKE